jgi:hypothetical protein
LAQRTDARLKRKAGATKSDSLENLQSQGGIMQGLSEQLVRAVEIAEPILRSVPEAGSETPVLKGGWSRKQLIGHLIDSASNNHQRFVRASLQGSLDFPGYDQDGCVRVQVVQSAPWPLLITLWANYNLYLAHVIAHLPTDKLEAQCQIGDHEPVTLKFLAEDYLTHLLHHLGQIGVSV